MVLEKKNILFILLPSLKPLFVCIRLAAGVTPFAEYNPVLQSRHTFYLCAVTFVIELKSLRAANRTQSFAQTLISEEVSDGVGIVETCYLTLVILQNQRLNFNCWTFYKKKNCNNFT